MQCHLKRTKQSLNKYIDKRYKMVTEILSVKDHCSTDCLLTFYFWVLSLFILEEKVYFSSQPQIAVYHGKQVRCELIVAYVGVVFAHVCQCMAVLRMLNANAETRVGWQLSSSIILCLIPLRQGFSLSLEFIFLKPVTSKLQ